jgi:hypothetical protein
LHAVTVKCSWILWVPSVTSRGVIDAFETFRRAGIARSAIWIVPVPDGHPLAVVVDDGTVAVCFDTNTVEPEPFFAVTVKRNVMPASACPTVYVLPVAPLIAAQPSPFASQRLQAYATLVGLPLQVPSLAVNVEPTAGVPEILGAVVGVGAAGPETAADGADVAVPEPVESLAVTVTRSACPTSSATAV